MNEKILAQSKQYEVKKFFRVMVMIGAILTVIFCVASIADSLGSYSDFYETYEAHELNRTEGGDCGWLYESWERCWECKKVEKYPNGVLYGIANIFEYDLYVFLPVVAFAVLGGLIYGWLRSYELVVTDKRIYGKVAWGKRVDLPVDSVSATATVNLLKGVSVSTSSGKISFLMIKNAEEIYKVINDLLIERQQEKVQTQNTVNVSTSDDVEQLKKLKDLLDAGIITQEEFEAKKKQLLGL